MRSSHKRQLLQQYNYNNQGVLWWMRIFEFVDVWRIFIDILEIYVYTIM